MTTIIYGIHNCDTVKKAIKWLEKEKIDVQFHDVRKDKLDSAVLTEFMTALGWQQVLNSRSVHFRALPDAQKAALNQESAIALLLDNPAMMKRPLLRHHNHFYLGFSQAQYQAIFASEQETQDAK